MTKFDLNTKDFLQSMTQTEISEWGKIEEITTHKKLKKGDFFFQHFDHCDEVAIVSSGLFRIFLIDQEGDERTYSFIPERSFILDFFLTWGHSKRMVSVQALEESEIYTIKYKEFVRLMKHDPIWSEVYREVLLRNYMFKTKREIEFVQFNAKERLQKFIDNERIDVKRIPKSYLASYLGIQPPSLSRLLRDN